MTDEADLDPMEFAPDVCRVCGRVIGYGIRLLHLGYCDDHRPEDDEKETTH